MSPAGAVQGTPEPGLPRPAGIPEATVARLPVYLRALVALADRSVSTCSSEELAAAAGVNSSKLRKDLSYLGSYGRRGVGYDVEYLRYQIAREIGVTQDLPVVIVGIGNLGHALANYAGISSRGFRIVALLEARRTDHLLGNGGQFRLLGEPPLLGRIEQRLVGRGIPQHEAEPGGSAEAVEAQAAFGLLDLAVVFLLLLVALEAVGLQDRQDLLFEINGAVLGGGCSAIRSPLHRSRCGTSPRSRRSRRRGGGCPRPKSSIRTHSSGSGCRLGERVGAANSGRSRRSSARDLPHGRRSRSGRTHLSPRSRRDA